MERAKSITTSTGCRNENSDRCFCCYLLLALTNPDDSAHRDAVALDDVIAGATIVTADEVLTEFKTFFASDPWLRRRAAVRVRHLLANGRVHVIPQSRDFFVAGLSLYCHPGVWNRGCGKFCSSIRT